MIFLGLCLFRGVWRSGAPRKRGGYVFFGQIPNPTPGDLGHPISQNPPLFDCYSKNPTPKPEIAIKGN